MTIEYDGTCFYGWQVQKEGRTVQGVIETALQKIFKNLFASNIKRIKHQEKVENPYHIFHGQIRSRFNTKFLRENKDWLR